jgi:hypothetical protein
VSPLPRFLEIDKAALRDEDRAELARVAESALAWCNGVIAEYDGTPQEHLACGVPGDPYHCSLAETLNAGLALPDQDPYDWTRRATVRYGEVRVGVTREVAQTPEAQNFSAFFDARLYPDLIEGE